MDWEVEVVMVIGRHAYKVSAQNAWAHVAGLTVGQNFIVFNASTQEGKDDIGSSLGRGVAW